MKVAFFDTKPYDRIFFSDEEEFSFFDTRLSEDTAGLAEGAGAVCIFVNDTVDRACAEKLSKLGVKHVALRCAGFNNVDIDACKDSGMVVTRVPEYSPYAVAEHTIALLLTLNRQIHRAYNRVREHDFSLHGLVGTDLHGKTAGVLGAGKIGRITAGIFKGFGCEVLASDPQIDEGWAENAGIGAVSQEELFSRCDFISLHLPLTKDTHHIISGEALGQMKDSAVLINTGRGKLVDTHALIEALKSQAIGGVALDVYEEEEGVFFENLSDEILQDDQLSRLLTFPNVLVTSHQAFLTREALSEIARVTCDNLSRIGRGEEPSDGSGL